MNRRQFLKNVYKTAGVVGLMNVGLSLDQAKCFGDAGIMGAAANVTVESGGGVLLGSDVIQSDSTVFLSNTSAHFYQDAFTQTPIGQIATTSGTATNAYVYLDSAATGTLHVLVCDSDGVELATGSTSISGADATTWVGPIALSSSVTITNGEYYGLCIGRTVVAGSVTLKSGVRIGGVSVVANDTIDWDSIGTITDANATPGGPVSAYLA